MPSGLSTDEDLSKMGQRGFCMLSCLGNKNSASKCQVYCLKLLFYDAHFSVYSIFSLLLLQYSIVGREKVDSLLKDG